MVTAGSPRRLAQLANKDIVESSGVAVSRRRANTFWTHNDSGDRPRLFAFDTTGADLGACDFQGAEAIDWEDMASFERDGKNWLLVADVGDNGLLRKSYQLYLCEEPDPGTRAVKAQRLTFQYENGPHNCESLGVDAHSGVILLATKVVSAACEVYQLELPTSGPIKSLVAHKIATIPVPVAVGMDISPDGQQAVVLTYGDAVYYSRSEKENWTQALSHPPQRLAMPARGQGESICFGREGKSLYLTSEKYPSPLWEVPLE